MALESRAKIIIDVVSEASAIAHKISDSFKSMTASISQTSTASKDAGKASDDLTRSLLSQITSLSSLRDRYSAVSAAFRSGNADVQAVSAEFAAVAAAAFDANMALQGSGAGASKVAHQYEEIENAASHASKSILGVMGAVGPLIPTLSSVSQTSSAVSSAVGIMSSGFSSAGGVIRQVASTLSSVAVTGLRGLGDALHSVAGIATGVFSSAMGGVLDFLGDVARIATGLITVNIFGRIADGLRDAAGAAFEAASQFQGLQIRFEMLAAREIADTFNRAHMHKETFQTISKLTDDELGKLEQLNLAYREQEIAMAGQQSRIDDLIKHHGQYNTVVEQAQIDLRQMQIKAGDLASQISTLNSRNGQLVTSTREVAGETMTASDAMDQAKIQAKDLLGWIQKIAVTSPFTVQDVAQTLAFAQSFGFTTKEAKELLPAIMNFTAGMGLGDEVMRRVIINFGQMKSMGKVTGRELIDLARGSLMPIGRIFEEMGKKVGKTGAEMEALAKSGKVDVTEFFKAFTHMAQSDFPDAMNRVSMTWQGVTSNIKDFVTSIVGGEVLGPLVSSLSEGMAKFLQMIMTDDLRTKAGEIGQMLATSFSMIKYALVALLPPLQDVITKILALFGIDVSKFDFSSIVTGIGEGTVAIVKFINNVKDFIKDHGPAFVEAIKKVKEWFDENWPKVLEFLDKMKTWWETDGITAVTSFTTAAKTKLSELQTIVAGLLAGLTTFGKQLSDAMANTGQAGAGDTSTPGAQAANTLKAVLEALDPVLKALAGTVSTAKDLLLPFFEQLGLSFGSSSVNGLQLKDVLTGIVMTVGPMLAATIGAIAGVIALVTSFFVGLKITFEGVVSLISGMVMTTAGVFTILKGLFTLNTEEIKQGWDTWVAGIHMSWDGLWRTAEGILIGVLGSILVFITTFIQTIISYFKILDKELVGQSIIPDMMKKIHLAVTSGLETTKKWLASQIEVLRKLGEDMFEGMAEGVRMKITQITNTVIAGIKHILSEARRALGIASPSKEFIAIGTNMMTGMQKGIEDSAALPAAAIAGIASPASLAPNNAQALTERLGKDIISAPAPRGDSGQIISVEIPMIMDGREIGRATVNGTLEELQYRSLRVVPVA